MRYTLGQKLYGVHFVTASFVNDAYSNQWYSKSYLHTEDPVVKITLVELEVKEHHKVPYKFDTDNKLDCDGYLLQDEKGRLWSNQYPRASYGQISCIGDYRFSLYYPSFAEFMKTVDKGGILECHLLTDSVEEVYRFLNKEESKKESPKLYENLTKLISDIEEELKKKNLKLERGTVSFGELPTDPKINIFNIVEMTDDNQRNF